MAKSTKNSKKYSNHHDHKKNLQTYLDQQIKKKKHQDALQNHALLNEQAQANKTVIQQHFELPFYGKLAYVYGFFIKYIAFTVLFSLFSMLCLFLNEIIINPNSYSDADNFIAHFWYFLFLIPFSILLICCPFTKYCKNLIENYRVTEESIDIIYTNKTLKAIFYEDVYFVTTKYAGTGERIFLISFYCQEAKKNISNFPLFIHYISIYNIYPINNKHEIISAFLQQHSIKNKYASINSLFLFDYHIDSTTFILDKKALRREKRFWYIFWLVILTIASGLLAYAFLTPQAV